MSDTTRNTPACDLSGIREAVCVHTDKITDSLIKSNFSYKKREAPGVDASRFL